MDIAETSKIRPYWYVSLTESLYILHNWIHYEIHARYQGIRLLPKCKKSELSVGRLSSHCPWDKRPKATRGPRKHDKI